MDQRGPMYRNGWQGNPRSAPPRDEFNSRPYSGYQGVNRGATADLVGMASALRAMPNIGRSRDSDYRTNQGPTRERPPPAREDPYARRQDFPKQEDPYARRNGGRPDPGYNSDGRPKPHSEDPYARRQEDPYARRNADRPWSMEEPRRERSSRPKENAYVKKHDALKDDPYSKGNRQRNWADSPKDSSQWPVMGGMIPRAGLPAYRGRFDQPLQSSRSPYVNRNDARRSLTEYTGSGSSSGSRSDYSGRWLSKNKFRLIIGFIVGILLIAMALGGVTLWLLLKGDDTYPVTYEVKVTLPNAKFVENMKKTDSVEFTDMKKKYCEAVKSVFGGTLLNCAVDQLSNGSVVVLSSLDFDWNDLTDLVKKTDKLPVPVNIYAYIKNMIENSKVEFLKGAKASTQVVPETVKYTLKLRLKGMNWTDDLSKPGSEEYIQTEKNYCDAMTKAFSDTMNSNGCKVKEFTEGSVKVESELSFNTEKMKKKAKAEDGSVDLVDLGSVVEKQLKKVANEMPYFKDNGLDTENITVKSETIQATTTTTAPAATKTSQAEEQSTASTPSKETAASATSPNAAPATTNTTDGNADSSTTTIASVTTNTTDGNADSSTTTTASVTTNTTDGNADSSTTTTASVTTNTTDGNADSSTTTTASVTTNTTDGNADSSTTTTASVTTNMTYGNADSSTTTTASGTTNTTDGNADISPATATSETITTLNSNDTSTATSAISPASNSDYSSDAATTTDPTIMTTSQ